MRAVAALDKRGPNDPQAQKDALSEVHRQVHSQAKGQRLKCNANTHNPRQSQGVDRESPPERLDVPGGRVAPQF